MRYLVIGSEGPGFGCPAETISALEGHVLPTFDALMKLESEKRILAGGLPVGERAFFFIMEASSNAEVDELLRDLPAWGVLNWDVKPLQSLQGRAEKERVVLRKLKQHL